MDNKQLKNYNERWWRRVPSKMVDIITMVGVVAILDVLVKWLHADLSVRGLVVMSSVYLAIAFYLFRERLFEKLKPKELFTAEFDFRQPDDETLRAAVEGIFSLSKSQPYFIHAVPPNKEIEQVISALEGNGKNFIHIDGGPGEGKSMLAFHAIYKLQQAGNVRCYSLNVDKLINRKEDEISKILDELDSLPAVFSHDPSTKLILVDDAHRLAFAYQLEELLREEAEQGNGAFIWITTDLEKFDRRRKETGELTIDFQSYYMILTESLYQPKDPRIRGLMTTRFPTLQLAIAETEARKIDDVWTFNFVATNGFERLKADVAKLREEDKYILYLLSAYTSIMGEEPLFDTEFYNLLVKFKPAWFQLTFPDFQRSLRGLSEQKPEEPGMQMRRMLLRVRDFNRSNVQVESLHYLFATKFIQEASNEFPEAERLEMLNATRALLNEDWKTIRYLSTFLRNVGSDAKAFLQINAAWIQNYFEHIQVNHLQQYSLVLRVIWKVDNEMVSKILSDDYFQRHGPLLSEVPANRLHALADIFRILPPSRRVAALNHLDVSVLSETVSQAGNKDFKQTADLILVFGERGEELLKELTKEKKLNKIVDQISQASVSDFLQATKMIMAFGKRRDELLRELVKEENLNKIINQISEASVSDFSQAAAMIRAFGERKEQLLTGLIEQGKLGKIIDQMSHATISDFQGVGELIMAFGERKEELLKELTKEENLNKIINQISEASVSDFSQAAAMIRGFGKRKEEILKGLMEQKKLGRIIDQISNATIGDFQGIGELIKAFGERKEELLKELTKEENLNKIIDRISQASVSDFLQAVAMINVFGKRKDDLLKELAKEDKLYKIIDQISQASVSDFLQATAMIMAFGERKDELLRELVKDEKLNKIVGQICQASVSDFPHAAAMIIAFGERTEELLKELTKQMNLEKIADQISQASVIDFPQATAMIMAFGERKDELLRELAKDEKLNKIIDQISQASVIDFPQAAAMIRAFGERKEQLLTGLIEQGKLGKIIDQMSYATISDFQGIGELIAAFGEQKEQLLTGLIEQGKLGKIIDQMSHATISDFQGVGELMMAFGERKDDLLKELTKEENLNKIIDQISQASVRDFSQAAAMIRAFGDRKDDLLKELAKEDKLNKIIDQISQAPVGDFLQAAAMIKAFGKRKEQLLTGLIEQGKLGKIIDQISHANIGGFQSVEALITAFGERKEELLKELAKEENLNKIIDRISQASVRNFPQAAAIIIAFGKWKEQLLTGLIEQGKLGRIIDQISRANIGDFQRVEALITAFGERKEELLSGMNPTFLNERINYWELSSLFKSLALIRALGDQAMKVLVPFSRERFLALSHRVTGQEIVAYKGIVSSLPREEQLYVIYSIPWLELLERSDRFDPVHLNNLAHIAWLYQQSKIGKSGEETRVPLAKFLAGNRSRIKNMIFNTTSQNYAALFNSVLMFARIDKNMTAGILVESVRGLWEHFEVFPKISKYVSRLMYLFYVIQPAISFKMLLHPKVNRGLKEYCRSQWFDEDSEGAKALVKAIRNSNKKSWEEEFVKDERIASNISKFDIAILFGEQDNDRRYMDSLGLDFFKLDYSTVDLGQEIKFSE
jgi:uncharacterized protein YigA (DUF484 family)